MSPTKFGIPLVFNSNNAGCESSNVGAGQGGTERVDHLPNGTCNVTLHGEGGSQTFYGGTTVYRNGIKYCLITIGRYPELVSNAY